MSNKNNNNNMPVVNMPVVTLANGLNVANFSSPHEFKFTSGEVLPACSAERAKGLMLAPEEKVMEDLGWQGYETINLAFRMTTAVGEALEEALLLPVDVDIVIVPLPVMVAIKESTGWSPSTSPFRSFNPL